MLDEFLQNNGQKKGSSFDPTIVILLLASVSILVFLLVQVAIYLGSLILAFIFGLFFLKVDRLKETKTLRFTKGFIPIFFLLWCLWTFEDQGSIALKKWIQKVFDLIPRWWPFKYSMPQFETKMDFYLYWLSSVCLGLIGIYCLKIKKFFIEESIQPRFTFFNQLPFRSWFQSHKRNSEFLLGKTKNDRPFTLTARNLAYHVQIVAPTGSGKTNILKNLMQHELALGHGLLFFDCKAELEMVAWMVEQAEKVGRASDIRLLCLSSPELSVPYNPFEKGTAFELHSMLMNSLVWSEPYYRNIASIALMHALQALVALRPLEGFSLESLVLLFTSHEKREEILEKLRKLNLDTRAFEEFSEELGSKKREAELLGLVAQIKQFLFSSAGELFKQVQGTFSFQEAIEKKQIVLVLLNSLKLKESATALGRIMLQDLMSYVGNVYAEFSGAKTKGRTTLVIDEFASFATPEFIQLMDRARGANLGIVLAHQARADLQAIAPEFHTRIEANANTVIVSGVKTKEDAEYYAGLLGTSKTYSETVQMQKTLFFTKPTGMKTVTVEDEFKLHPNELRALSQGEVFAVSKTIDPRSGIVKVPRACETRMDPESVKKILQAAQGLYNKQNTIQKDGTLQAEEPRSNLSKKKLQREKRAQTENAASSPQINEPEPWDC